MVVRDWLPWTAVGAGVYVAARLLFIARFDVSTAATILQASGTATLVAGTALSLLPFALPFVSLAFALAVFWDSSLLGANRALSRFLLTLSLVALVAITTLLVAILTLGLVVVIAAFSGRVRDEIPDGGVSQLVARSRSLRIAMTIFASLLFLAPIIQQRPWFPLEYMATSEGAVVVGYVLGETQGHVAVMEQDDRSIVLVDIEDISDRGICELGGSADLAAQIPQIRLGQSLLGEVMWRDAVPKYSRCPQKRSAA